MLLYEMKNMVLLLEVFESDMSSHRTECRHCGYTQTQSLKLQDVEPQVVEEVLTSFTTHKQMQKLHETS
jgi:HJR/Mrr/RecB family endonuclease